MDETLQQRNYLFFSGLLLLAASLPLSLFITSLSQFILLAAFLFEDNPVTKLKRFGSNKAALLFCGIWVLHLAGMLWTQDVQEGLKDLRIKLPILLLPVIIAGSRPLSQKQFRAVMYVFIAAVLAGTLISMAVLAGFIPGEINDIRDVFIFKISHIRFSLFVCLSIFTLLHFNFKGGSIKQKTAAIIISAWFIYFLIIVESITGLVIMGICAVFILISGIFSEKNKKKKLIYLSILIGIPVIIFFSLRNLVNEFYKVRHPVFSTSEKTSQGNEYKFENEAQEYENGYPVYAYLCEPEMRTEWNRLSNVPYDSLDERNQAIRFTLMRFLSSKGLRKDGEGVRSLSQSEVRSVEKGIANVNYQDVSSLKVRLMQIIFEADHYAKGGSPSGHSITQRLEFWKAGWNIFKKNPLTGVGTGDMPLSYKSQYEEMQSRLDVTHRLRAHNQFLSILVAFGVLGCIYFAFALMYPFLKNYHRNNFLFFVFMLIALLSMMTEDTLETQPGATFVAFFFSLYIGTQSARSSHKVSQSKNPFD
jgi:hypothetical protein